MKQRQIIEKGLEVMGRLRRRIDETVDSSTAEKMSAASIVKEYESAKDEGSRMAVVESVGGVEKFMRIVRTVKQ